LSQRSPYADAAARSHAYSRDRDSVHRYGDAGASIDPTREEVHELSANDFGQITLVSSRCSQPPTRGAMSWPSTPRRSEAVSM
jgi:hypothetical protein